MIIFVTIRINNGNKINFAVINEVFTPSEAQIDKANAIVAAFAAKPGAGTVGIDGKMYDRPHLARAQALLASRKS